MPTIIDSLVVELGLDSSKFTEAQRQATQRLRDFEQTAAASAGRIATGPTSNSIKNYFSSINSGLSQINQRISRGFTPLQRFASALGLPFGQANRSMVNLAAQSTRTGQAVAAGAQHGTYSLQNLVKAGLEVYGAFKSVQTVMGQLGAASSRGANLGRVAWQVDLPVRRLDALVQMAHEVANVPQDTSLQMFAAWRHRIAEQQRTGQWSPEFTEAQRAGVQFNAPMEQQIRQIRRFLAGKSGPEAEAWASAVGLGPWLQVLRMSQDEADRALARAERHSLTAEQTQKLTDLQKAVNRTQNSFTHLWEAMASESGVAPFLERASQVIDALSKEKDFVKALDAAFAALTATLTVLAGRRIWQFLVGGAAARGAASAAGGTAAGGVGSWIARALGGGGLLTGIGAFLWGMRPGTAGVPGVPNERDLPAMRELYRRHGAAAQQPSSFTSSAPSGSLLGLSQRDRENRAIAYFQGKGLTRAQAVGFTARLSAESVGMNPTAVNPTSGAYGLAQWLGSRKPAALATGGDFNKQLDLIWNELQGRERRALANIKASNTAVDAARAAESYERAGNPAFTEYAARYADKLMKEIGSTDNVVAGNRGWPFRVQAGAPSLPVNTTGWGPSTGPGWSGTGPTGATDKFGRPIDVSKIPDVPMPAYVAAYIRDQNARIAQNTANDNRSSTVNVGDVNVSTQASNPMLVGGAVSDAIKRMVYQANTGLS